MPMPMTAGSRGAGGLVVIGQASTQASKQLPSKQQDSNALSIVYNVNVNEPRTPRAMMVPYKYMS